VDQRVTRLDLDPPSGGSSGRSLTLPPDLLEQVRGRLGLLALLMMVAFALDPLLFFGGWIAITLNEGAPAGYFRDAGFYWGDLAVVAGSALLWRLARSRRIPIATLQRLGLAYQVLICFVIAFRTFWEYYRDTGILPNLTWAPAVIILFPLVLPAPPGLMLAASVTAAAMPLLALVLLEAMGQITVGAAYYINAAVASAIAVGFAYMGSRVVYGLGRAVAAARELGSYHLEEKLGQGGMGQVWRARHRMLARPAAIKLIRPSRLTDGRSGVSAEAIRRFEREAQVIAGLRSPHTVELFDFGVAADGAFFYVMELLDGMDAERLVRKFGPVPAERAVFLLRQICHSLSEAGARGLVHRDVKPANVFLCRYGEEHDFVKLLDFGIVKAPDAADRAGPAATSDDAVQGTPAFIAPEQALGGAPLDGRADIYATGCVAYWLLTGELVFTADNAIALLLQHAHAPPVPPSSRTSRPIPPALDDLILSCLAKDPGRRPQTAAALRRQLDEVELPAAWTEDRARAWWAEHQPAGRSAT
jgi:hypothetical protein